MPINFKPASQNGAVPPTPAKYKQSKLGLIASTTTSVLGQPIIVKALSDAAYYKTSPVTLYAFNPDTNQTIATTSSFIDTVQAPFVLNNLPNGQWQLWAEWPGDGPFVAKTTQANLISLTVTNTGVNIGGRLTLIPSPASGSLVAGEGTATFFATITNVTSFLGGSLLFYDGNQQIGSVPLVQNHASFSTDQLTAGTHNITVKWPGGLIGGTKYQGFSTSTNYAISSGTVSGTTLNLTVSPNHGVFQEGYITLTASLTNGAANYPGSVVFYRDGVELYTAPIVGTTATYIYRNFEAVGSTVFKAEWDGNSAAHPRFIPVASSTASWTVVAKETPSRLSVAVVPNPTAFSAPTYFTATFHQLTGEPLVPGEVVFYADDVVVGRAPIINDVATTSNRYIMTGTHAVYAYYAGSAEEPKFYSTRSESVSLVVNEGLNIGAALRLSVTNDSYKGTTTPYVKGETQRFTANITTSRQMTGLAYFAINGVENFSAPWINNSATTTTVFSNSGTYAVQAIWHGGDIGGNFYATTSSTVTNLTVLDGYTLTQPITLSPSLVRVIDEPLTITAAVTTSSGMRGTMTFYANALNLGTAQWNSTTNQAVLTAPAPASSGTYTISALWSGGYIDDNRLYVGKTANTSSIFVDLAQRITSLTLRVGENPNSIGTQTILTATIVVTGTTFNNVDRGSVTFKNGATTLGTSTFINNIASITVPAGIITAGTNTITASYGGTSVIPKYYPATSSTSLSIINRTGPNLSTVAPDFYYHNLDGTINPTAYATLSISGVYHAPTGPAKLYDGATLLASIADVKVSQQFSWSPVSVIDSGTRTLTVQYLGDYWNTTATITIPFTARTRRSSSITLNGNSSTFYRPNTFTLQATSTSTYWNGRSLNLLDGGAFNSTAVVNGTLTNFLLDTRSLSTGTHLLQAQFEQDWAYNSILSNTSTITIDKTRISLVLDTQGTSTVYRPNNLTFNVRSTSTFNVAKPVTILDNGQPWVTFTYTGTLTSITTSSQTLTLGSHAYQVRFTEDSDYHTTSSNIVNVDSSKDRRPPLGILTSSDVHDNANRSNGQGTYFHYTLTCPNDYWNGKVITLQQIPYRPTVETYGGEFIDEIKLALDIAYVPAGTFTSATATMINRVCQFTLSPGANTVLGEYQIGGSSEYYSGQVAYVDETDTYFMSTSSNSIVYRII
jgi:hypothetical protein